MKCWGYNYFGQLGDGSFKDRHTAVDVVGLGSGVAEVDAGSYFTCALTTGGAVKCWGANRYGQLGDGTTTNRDKPVDVVGLGSGVVAVSAGDEQACALTTGGAVKCWGRNDVGQLGDGTTTERDTPVDVVGLGSGVTALSSGVHSCALTDTGALKCWGYNNHGQVGDGSVVNRATPVGVSGLGSGVSFVNAGLLHTCALTSADATECWGDNEVGEVGDGTTSDRLAPVDVLPFATVGVRVSGPVRAGVGFAVTATALDSRGNTVSDWAAPATWSSLDGVLKPGKPSDFVDGVSTTTAKVGVPFHADRITVTSGGASGQSDPFDVVGSFSTVGVNVATPVTATVPFRVIATAEDSAGNTIPDYNAAATWSSLDGGLSPPGPAAFVNGVSRTNATIPARFTGDRISVSSGGLTGESGPFDVVGPVSITVKLGGQVQVGVPFTVTATARDPAGHKLTGFNAPASWTSLDGTLTPRTPSRFANGVSWTTASVAVPFHHDLLTVSGGGASGQVSFNAFGPLASVAMKLDTGSSATEPLTVGAGSQFTVKATAVDAAGNVLTSYQGSASWSSLDGAISPGNPAGFIDGVSTTAASIPGPFKNDEITVQTGGVSGTSNPFTVVGPLAAIKVKVTTPITAGQPFTVKATATDSLGTPLKDYDATATWSSLDGGLTPATPSAFVYGVSTTTATIPSAFANDLITVTSGGINGRSGSFNVH